MEVVLFLFEIYFLHCNKTGSKAFLLLCIFAPSVTFNFERIQEKHNIESILGVSLQMNGNFPLCSLHQDEILWSDCPTIKL